MLKLTSSKILETATEIEEQSYALYMTAQEKAELPSSRKFLRELAWEEEKHKERLLALMKDRERLSQLDTQRVKVQDLKIVDFMEDTPLSADADYATILVYAAKREKSTYEYYNHLATGLEGTEIGKLFFKLAQEELSHKNKLEVAYDEYVMREN